MWKLKSHILKEKNWFFTVFGIKLYHFKLRRWKLEDLFLWRWFFAGNFFFEKRVKTWRLIPNLPTQLWSQFFIPKWELFNWRILDLGTQRLDRPILSERVTLFPIGRVGIWRLKLEEEKTTHNRSFQSKYVKYFKTNT